MSETVKLKVINQTRDIDAASLVVCQHNAAAGLRANPVAWQVLRNVLRQEARAFDIPQAFDIGLMDASGRMTPQVSAEAGQAYELLYKGPHPTLSPANVPADKQNHVEVRHAGRAGQAGGVVVNAYKSGRLLATKLDLHPGEAARFQFHPHVYIGLAAQLEEAAVLSIAAASQITTRINLLGVTSADIVMTTSERGPRQPNFLLENIQ